MKKAFGAISISMMLGFGFAGASSALTYQDGSDVQFTFNSTLSIALSDADIVIGGLIPGQDGLSNVVDIVVNTNNLYGYTLTATVGNASHDYRDLRHDTNSSANFAGIAVDSDLATLSGESSSVWGYKVSTNGTTWSNFNGLPKYDDTSSTAELNVTDGAAADSTTSFRIGAYAAEGQLAGDYSNVINFKVVSNGAPAGDISNSFTMQNVLPKSAGGCPSNLPTGVVYQLTDTRDGEVYDVARLADGNCWLLENLRLDLVAVSLDDLKGATNASDTSLTYLKNGGGTSSDKYAITGVVDLTNNSNGYSFSEPRTSVANKDATSTGGYSAGKHGAYYNFCAASAGSYCYGSGKSGGTTSGNATEDICPKGWGIPTDYRALYAAYNSNYNDFVNALRTPLSGEFYHAFPSYQGSDGWYWTSARSSDGLMDCLHVTTSTAEPQHYQSRYIGSPVRCILK